MERSRGSDDGHCTHANLYNEWVDIKKAREEARVLFEFRTGVRYTKPESEECFPGAYRAGGRRI